MRIELQGAIPALTLKNPNAPIGDNNEDNDKDPLIARSFRHFENARSSSHISVTNLSYRMLMSSIGNFGSPEPSNYTPLLYIYIHAALIVNCDPLT